MGQHLLKAPISPKAKDIIDERDYFEKEVVLASFKEKIPMLAICRGAQVLNTALGGGLNQHIPRHVQNEPRNQPTHFVRLNKDSLLYDILGKERIRVNSFHHQCVDKVADRLKISAIWENEEKEENDRVIEAIEYAKRDYFALALQWHPEALWDRNSQKIFSYFARECRK